MMYLLDSNIYINFYDRYYRLEIFPTFWTKLIDILNSKVIIPDIVISENYQDEWFKKWLKTHYTKAIVEHKNFVNEWAYVLQRIQDSPFYNDLALDENKGWTNVKIADPWLIAIALKEKVTIVTNEVKNVNLNTKNPSKSVKIPDICQQLGVRCITMNEFFKEVKLSI